MIDAIFDGMLDQSFDDIRRNSLAQLGALYYWYKLKHVLTRKGLILVVELKIVDYRYNMRGAIAEQRQ